MILSACEFFPWSSCVIQLNGDSQAKVQRILRLISGGGLSITGSHILCGDFLFSGHTVVLTLTYLFIKECKECLIPTSSIAVGAGSPCPETDGSPHSIGIDSYGKRGACAFWFLVFGCAPRVHKFPSQESDPHHGSDNMGSLISRPLGNSFFLFFSFLFSVF